MMPKSAIRPRTVQANRRITAPESLPEYFVEVWSPCPTCYGSGEVAGAGGGHVPCPECEGSPFLGRVPQLVAPRQILSGGYMKPLTKDFDPG